MSLCSFEGCEKPIKGTGLCSGHYQQKAAGKELRPLIRSVRAPRPVRLCEVDGCERKHASRGMCDFHYRQVLRGREFSLVPYEPPTSCGFDGCAMPPKALGLCGAHYRQQKSGMPLTKTRTVVLADQIARGVKWCSGCERELPVEEFSRGASSVARGLDTYCKSCNSDRRFTIEYGITKADRDAVFEMQGRRCAICGTDDPGTRTSGRGDNGWHTDHDHDGAHGYAVRGILCSDCNVNLGIHEAWSIPNRDAIATYLESPLHWLTPEEEQSYEEWLAAREAAA